MKKNCLDKNILIFLKTIKSNGKIIVATFLNFLYVSGYLQSAW